MITNEGIENLWRAHVGARYNKLERARPWGLNDDAKRHLVWLWQSCNELDSENAGKLFETSLEQLADIVGLNVLQPLSPNELKAPELWRDLWANPLPNPWATKDLKSQSLVMQRDPVLGEWLKKFAESPYAAAAEWQDKQAAILKQKALNYDADSHRANVFANGASETEKAQFVKNAPAHVVERARWEAWPIEFPTAGKGFSLTAQGRISRIPQLSGLFNAMLQREHNWRVAARAKARADIETAKRNLQNLEAATSERTPKQFNAAAQAENL
jgi:hypothetical protein